MQPILLLVRVNATCMTSLAESFTQKDLDLIMCDVTFLHPIIRTIVRIESTSRRKNTVDQE